MRKTKEFTNVSLKTVPGTKAFEKTLEPERIHNEGYNHMIELAEQQFNIPIRKKSGTKQ